jgi:hypothetical protein
MPENDLAVSEFALFTNGMTEEKFNAIINKVADVYRPLFKEKKMKLKIKRAWQDETVNAYAYKVYRWRYIKMFGGLARHPDVTDDAFALVVCHEIGHHFAGAPKIGGDPKKWASNEGQSDYWGALKCFRRVFINDDNIYLMSLVDVDPLAKTRCFDAWSGPEAIALCERISMAGLSLGTLLNNGSAVYLDQPDQTVVTKTLDQHPNGQCRTDTYFHAALCPASVDLDVSNSDPTVGVCFDSSPLAIGTRRACWYAPPINKSLAQMRL